MATPEVSEPPRPRVVVFPLASKPWKPATTITRPASRSLVMTSVSIDSIRALVNALSVLIPT